jgi:hypothetical protein
VLCQRVPRAYVSMRQHTSACVSIRQHTSALLRVVSESTKRKESVAAAVANTDAEDKKKKS